MKDTCQENKINQHRRPQGDNVLYLVLEIILLTFKKTAYNFTSLS